MKVTMTMNAAKFNQVLAQVNAASSRSYPKFLNGQALRLASYAIHNTKKADANKIAWQLGQTDRRFTNLRTGGKLKTPKRIYGNSEASLGLYRIVNWRRKRSNKPAISGEKMSVVARKLRARALKSVGYIASGWIYSVKELSRMVGYEDRVAATKSPARMTGKTKGYVIPATFAINSKVNCTIANLALIEESSARTGRRKGNPMPIAERGLAIARQLTANNMMEHLRKKLQPVLNAHSARR